MSILISALISLNGTAHAAVFNAKTATLENGLQVVVVENHMAPVVTHMMWIKAGAADEVQGVSGIAHYLEHLMFKGTAKVPNGEYSARIAQVGGTENAFTSWDYTAYFATVAKANLPMVMELEADRLAHLQIKKELATPELAVVLDERRQRVEDEPFAPLLQQMAAALFPHHPYGIPVIGWKEEIEKFTVEDARRFYETWYQPSNAVVIVSGDVKAEEVFALAKKTFGVLPTKRLAPRIRTVDPQFKGNTTIVLEHEHVKQTTLLRSYKIAPARKDPANSIALQVLEELLDASDASFLPRRLIQEKNLASSVNVNYESDLYDDGQFVISLVPKPNVTKEQLLAELDAALQEYAKTLPNEDDMKAARRSLQRQAVLARDSVMGPAQTIGVALVTGQTLDDVENWPEQIAAVKAEEVQKALKSILETPSVTGVLKPKEGLDLSKIAPSPHPSAQGAIK
ncbi:MAG: pitrilysin family protein [Alphaproteobacteria bacterium]|nr:pitrilysin family protein [Alphaproteobacteria bacterium]